VPQIVDFAGGLVSKTKEYYDNGFLIDYKDYAAAATKLEALTKELEKSTKQSTQSISNKSTQPTSEVIVLRNITVECRDVAGDFISVLNDLKVEGKHHAWKKLLSGLQGCMVERKDRCDANKAASASGADDATSFMGHTVRVSRHFCESH
jgi:hypothetical protein